MSTFGLANEANCKEVYKMLSFTKKRYEEKGNPGNDFSTFALQENARISKIKPAQKTKTVL